MADRNTLFDVATGAEKQNIAGVTGAITPDERLIITGNADSTMIWDAVTGQEIVKLLAFTHGGWAMVDAQGPA